MAKWSKIEVKQIEDHILSNKKDTAIAIASHNTEYRTPKVIHRCVVCGGKVRSDIDMSSYLDYHSVSCPYCDDVQKILILNIRD